MTRKSVSSDEVIKAVEEVKRLVDRVSRLEEIINANKGLFKTPVKKSGWVARLDGGMSVNYIIFPSEESVKECVPDALSYHEISWEE